MKKRFLLGSLLTLSAIAMTGCSFSKDGTYKFSYIEYAENGETKQSDCSDPKGDREKSYCSIVKTGLANEYTITLEKNKITYLLGETEVLKDIDYKVVNGVIKYRESEDKDYKDSSFKYSDNTIQLENDYFTIVYKK